MASSQKIRTPSVSNVGLFPSDIASKEKSLMYVSRLLCVTSSSIAYLRNIFDEDTFSTRKWGNYSLRILNGKDKDSKFLINCMSGAFDALSKGYLREIILGIANDRRNPDDVLETYTFKINYTNEGNASLTVAAKTRATSFQSDNVERTIDQVNDSMQRLLRQLLVFTETLDSVPKNSFFTMKLLYYDERTPADYEPPGFEPSNTIDFSFGEKVRPCVFGNLETNHHAVKASVRSILFKKNKPGDENVSNSVEIADKRKIDKRTEVR